MSELPFDVVGSPERPFSFFGFDGGEFVIEFSVEAEALGCSEGCAEVSVAERHFVAAHEVDDHQYQSLDGV